MSRFRRVRENGIVFVFKTDEDDPTLLHIYARHLTTIDDALDVYFDASATETWNTTNERYERFNRTHGLFWFWLDEVGKVVMVITCFSLEGESP
jgi:hypothetical protein